MTPRRISQLGTAGRRDGAGRGTADGPRRYRWVDGIATVRPDDDPLARQLRVIAWHPLRALNAMYVRVWGADLLTVHVRLALPGRGTSVDPQETSLAGEL